MIQTIVLPDSRRVSHIDEFLREVRLKSDNLINYFLFAFFTGGLLLAFFYDTWTVAIGVGGLSLIAYYSAKRVLPDSNLYQYILSAVLGIFMAQYIYQMHGLFEMHFIAFIGSAILITYQNWKLQIPLTLVVVAHHALFGYMQYVGFDKIYFTQLDYMSLQTFIIHVILAAGIFFICGLWAYHFKKYSELHIAQSFEIGKLEEEKVKQDALKALNETLEQKVIERTSELETVNKELDGFNYSVSHDLRAPLRVIQGYGKMLLKTASPKLDSDERDNLLAMVNNSKRMGQLVDDLLDFSRLGRAQLSRNPVDMEDVVKCVLKELKASEPNVHAEIHVQNMQQAHCDPTLIRQVWMNLISNAVKYSRKKEFPVIEIGSTGLNGHQIFYVKDNGAGFDMQYSGKLFGVFQRLHKITEYEGTGVGLALVHRIVTRHGGKIWAEAKPEAGATFYFTLS
jgi:signal transduction histidine kinase